METMVKRSPGALTDLQQNSEKLELLRGQVDLIGRKYVAMAIDYNIQSVGDYLNRIRGSKKLETRIINNLEKALEIRQQTEQAQLEAARNGLSVCLKKIVEN